MALAVVFGHAPFEALHRNVATPVQNELIVVPIVGVGKFVQILVAWIVRVDHGDELEIRTHVVWRFGCPSAAKEEVEKAAKKKEVKKKETKAKTKTVKKAPKKSATKTAQKKTSKVSSTSKAKKTAKKTATKKAAKKK